MTTSARSSLLVPALLGAAIASSSAGCGARTGVDGLDPIDARAFDATVRSDAYPPSDARPRSDAAPVADASRPDAMPLDSGGPAYVCGVAMAGWGCDNGRRSYAVAAPTMSEAIAVCRASRPAGYPDFCYVLNRGDPAPRDESECIAALGSWRPGNECCNFMGTLSCP